MNWRNPALRTLSLVFIVALLIGFVASEALGFDTNSGVPQGQPPRALIKIDLAREDDLRRIEASGLPVYAHLVTGRREGTSLSPYLIAGATLDDQAALKREGFSISVLDEDVRGGKYYLVYPRREGQLAILKSGEYGRLLYDDGTHALLRTTAAQAERLPALGLDIKRLFLRPIALRPRAVSAIPSDIEYNPLVAEMIARVASTTVYSYTGGLSGEWPVEIGGSFYTIATRHTYSGEPIQKATRYVYEHFEDLELDVEYHQWEGSTYPNVIATKVGSTNPDDVYIICAHLDDMPAGSVAPGADDNASGSTAVMIAADILSQYNFGCTLKFALWTGEEQGLLGSDAYAERAAAAGDRILGVLNLDMIGWDNSGGPIIELHAISTLTPTLELARLFSDTVSTYNINLDPRIFTYGEAASDHSSFWDEGYTAILAIEDWGDFNAHYHTVNDRLEYLNLTYFTEFVKAAVGTFAHMSCLTGGSSPSYAVALNPASQEKTGAAGTVVTYTVQVRNTGTASDSYNLTLSGAAFPTTLWNADFTGQINNTGNIAAGGSLDIGVKVEIPTGASAGSSDTVTLKATSVTSATVQATATFRTRVSGSGGASTILLVDDDGDCDYLTSVESHYKAALDAGGYSYDYWNVCSQGAPGLAKLQEYGIVIWFTGEAFENTLTSSDESNLAAYLDGGGKLFLSSQDYFYDVDTITAFGKNYLHVGGYTNDTFHTAVTGANVFAGFGPYSFTTDFTFSDDVFGDGVSQVAFTGDATGNSCALTVDSSFKVVFFAFPFEGLGSADAKGVMQRIITWFGQNPPPSGRHRVYLPLVVKNYSPVTPTPTPPPATPTPTPTPATTTPTPTPATPTPTPTPSGDTWTFMVYLDGDNDLEGPGVEDFLEMAQTGSSANVKIVVQFDRIPDFDNSYGDWTSTKRFLVTKGMEPTAANAIADIGEANMGDPQTLIDFVNWARATYPADKYALVLWDHGSGWKMKAQDSEPVKDVCLDETNEYDALTSPELYAALRSITNDGSKPIHLIGFDACLMGMIEVDNQVNRPLCHVRVGAEEVEPGDGWPYELIVPDLVANPTWGPAQLGAAIVDRYYESYGNNEVQSAVDLGTPLTTLNNAVDNFAQTLIQHMSTYRSQYGTARNATQKFYGEDFLDLYDFARNINAQITQADINSAATAVMNAVSAAVIEEKHGADWPGAHGISIYFPTDSLDPDYPGSSGYLRFTQQTRWDEFLQAYLGSKSTSSTCVAEYFLGWYSSPTSRFNSPSLYERIGAPP